VWRLKKKTIVALSSTESEYVALPEAGREASWLRNRYGELSFLQNGLTVIKEITRDRCFCHFLHHTEVILCQPKRELLGPADCCGNQGMMLHAIKIRVEVAEKMSDAEVLWCGRDIL
jgi:hypothetical protein